ncbi:MAG: hypothetical protein WBN55_01775 [Eudoraea sp.]|uniref:hypothetical protein n=1 Tax=Eudoraea sp. TaxID=1979955 RepID=UPI003C760B38
MSRKIKLIWDFRGPTAKEVAMHHEKHLKDYIEAENLSPNITGNTDLSSMHSIAYMVVEEVNMTGVRDALIPHRGEVYSEKQN